MNTTPSLLLTALLGALYSTAALAADLEQAQNGEKREIVIARDIRQWGEGPGPMTGAAIRMGGKVVKNAPYSAEVSSERQQNLADGNQIVRKSVSLSYRDSAGRTRQEVRDDKGELRTVTIHDPVTRVTTILNPRNKTATQISPPQLKEAAQQRIEQLRKEGKLPQVRNEIILRRSGDDEDNVRIVSEGGPVQIEAREMAGHGNRPGEMMLGPIGGAFADMKWARKASTRDLGEKTIDGIRAEGKLRSYEIPAGEVGNRNPIVVSDETWFSPELQITVLTRHSDPRSGENVYRVGAIKREEPAPALFTVPADYTVKHPMEGR